jgi:hypothetical protein
MAMVLQFENVSRVDLDDRVDVLEAERTQVGRIHQYRIGPITILAGRMDAYLLGPDASEESSTLATVRALLPIEYWERTSFD